MKNRLFQKLGGGQLESFGLRTWSKLQFAALRSRKNPEVVELMESIHRDRRSLLSAFEQYTIYSLAKSKAAHFGAFAEVGVFKGASAKLLCEVKGDKPLLLFDTFEGLPQPSEADRDIHKKGQFAYGIEAVKDYLKKYNNVEYYQGIFPNSADGVPEQTYSLAHFDVDLYEGTLACLSYFYPRMEPGGIIVSHDYGLLAGVEQAFTEFFADKPEEVIELPTTQCIVFKL